MSQLLNSTPFNINVDDLVTEDDTPVDNVFSEKQQRLLTEPLYNSWPGPPPNPENPGERRKFFASANVGLFPSIHQPPLVPDVFLSLDVEAPEDWFAKAGRSYFFWEFGKAPEVVIEIVSNRKGNEVGSKLQDYARIGVLYYVVYDPAQTLSSERLRIYESRTRRYEILTDQSLKGTGLGLILWDGVYEGRHASWLRWCDEQGMPIPTGTETTQQQAERATREAERAEREAERAEREAERARVEAERAERYATKLRTLGISSEEL